MSEMLVDYIGRSDLRRKSGGDTFQMQEYITRLQHMGVDCRLVEYGPKMHLREGSIVHLINTARPFELLDSFRQATGHKVFVSPIHHSLNDISKMRMAEPGSGLRTIVGKVASESVRELIASTARQRKGAAAKLLVANAGRNVRRVRGLWDRVGLALDGAEAVFTLSETERKCLALDTGWSGANEIRIPNGRPEYPELAEKPWRSRSPILLSVGRIEPRKRQLEAARICVEEKIACKFIGSPNPATMTYVEEFSKLVEMHSNLTWEGEKSHSDVVDEMRKSRVFVNCSWVEVQSLVDIEANTAGCAIYTTTTGSTAEYLPDSTRSFPLDDLRSLLLAAAADANAGQSRDIRPYPYTWDAAADRLLVEYQRTVRV